MQELSLIQICLLSLINVWSINVPVMDGGVDRCQSVHTVLAGILYFNYDLPLTVNVYPF